MTNDPRHDPLDIEQARDLLAAYALGAVDAVEREQLESVLADWPEGRRELAELKFAIYILEYHKKRAGDECHRHTFYF